MWLAAWKLVSNGAKRTIPLPNAKHSTLLQGCFLCFCFSLHSQFRNKVNHCPPVFSTEPVLSLVEGGENASEQVGGLERVGGSLDVGRVEAKLGLAVERLTLRQFFLHKLQYFLVGLFGNERTLRLLLRQT